MSHRNLGWLLAIAAVALLGIAVSYSAPTREKDHDYELVRLVVDVLQEVRQRYVVEVDADRERKLVEDMINGGLERLDPHSQYINPKEFKQFSKTSEGKFGGIGIQIGYDRQGRGFIQVHSPMVGTPAYEAGVLAGDLIVKVDGKSTENMRVTEVADLIMGDPGEKVTLTVLHEGAKESVDIPIVRAVIEVHAVLGDLRKPDNAKEWDFFVDQENKIAYVRLVTFSKTAPQELRNVIEQLQKEGVRGLVLDLRHNGGGLLKAAVEISDLFLADGIIVSTRGRDQEQEVYKAKAAGTLLQPADKFPMAVLVNKWSASASEIVAAALQDHKRAIVVGERTFGKGSVQNVIEMKEGNEKSALKLTTASYWRPSGKNIHRFPDAKESDEWGVKPNPGYEVPQDEIAYLKYRIDRDVVQGKNGTQPPAKPKTEKETEKDKKPFEDKVLQKALEYLRGEIKKVGTAGRTAFEISNA
jgi:carboxyl-terminal processing protease